MIEAVRAIRAIACVVVAAVLAGCANKGEVVLLPEDDGHPTAVTVTKGDKVVVLDQPYAAVKVTPIGVDGYRSSAEQVEKTFGRARAAQPKTAERFVLYFVEGKDEFTDDSRRIVDQVLSEIARRPVPDVLVVGHTDAVGTDTLNDALGQRRAEIVRTALIGLGVPGQDIRATSRGKRELAVPTPDGVAEPRNRRVEIIVR